MGAPKITKEEFETIKLLRKTTKLTQEQIAEMIKRSVSSIGMACSFDTYEQYTTERTQLCRKYNAKRSEARNAKRLATGKDQDCHNDKAIEPELIPEIDYIKALQEFAATINGVGKLVLDKIEDQDRKTAQLITCAKDCSRLLKELNDKWK